MICKSEIHIYKNKCTRIITSVNITILTNLKILWSAVLIIEVNKIKLNTIKLY